MKRIFYLIMLKIALIFLMIFSIPEPYEEMKRLSE